MLKTNGPRKGQIEMVVKSKRGRKRYVAFTVNPELTKDKAVSDLRTLCDDPPYVIQCAEGWMIIRCSPYDSEEAIRLVKAADPSSVSLKTSGTLATLRKAYPELKRLRPARRAV